MLDLVGIPSIPEPAFLVSRLTPARLLAEANIPCVVWGEEALCWIHTVPTLIFSTLHLLVSHNQLDEAVRTLTQLLPGYALTDSDPKYAASPAELLPSERAKYLQDGRLPHAFPHSIRLAVNAPDAAPVIQRSLAQYILLTPDSFFHFDAADAKSLQPLPNPVPPSLQDVRFPKLAAFYDALLSTLAHPHRDAYAFRLRQQLHEYVAYLTTYAFREYVKCSYKEVDELPLRIREVGDALTAENRETFYAQFMRQYSDEDLEDDDWNKH